MYQSIRSVFVKPDPAQQKRKCDALIRQNQRLLDRDILNLKNSEAKTKTLILNASKRAQRDPSQKDQALLETKVFAREMLRVRKQKSRLVTSKAQLDSVKMQVNEAFAVRKIQTSMKTSAGIMREVNALVRMPELMGTMRELSQELMRAGIVDEMIGETLEVEDMMDEDEEAEEEIEKILGEVLKDRFAPVSNSTMPNLPTEDHLVAEEEEEMDLDAMRGRLDALKS